MIVDARTSVGTSDIELRNQIEYYGGRCPTTATALEAGPTVVASGAPTAPTREPAKAEVSKPTPSKPAAPKPEAVRSALPKADSVVAQPTPVAPRGTFTIQLAAYNTRPEAERLLTKLASRGVKARISGDGKPYRVRLDFYPTRQAAATAVAELKQRGIIGFVTEEARPSAGSSP
jgi:cell division protein FtsN